MYLLTGRLVREWIGELRGGIVERNRGIGGVGGWCW